MVTGASGFLGRHLTEAVVGLDWELYAPGSTSLDVRDREGVDDEMREWKPTAVAHLAYRKDDRRTIVAGSANVARAAAAVGARLVHVSTDVVFGGRPAAYREDDAPTPIGDYGTWKAEAEQAVMTAAPGAVMVRTSLLYGTSRLGHVQQEVEDAIRGRSRTRFFTDELRCPAHASDVAMAIAQLAVLRDVTGPLHVAGPEVLSRAQLAQRFATWLGHRPEDVPTGSVAASGLMRAGCVVLDSSKAASLGITCRRIDDVLGHFSA